MSLQINLLDVVGGHAFAGTESESLQWVQRVRSGLSIDSVQTILDSGRLAPAELDQIVLPRKTLAHRRKLGTLTAEQSDRLLRVARLIATAEDTFGDQAKAAKWLRRPTDALSGERPLDLLDTDEGARAVERLLGQISHGIAA